MFSLLRPFISLIFILSTVPNVCLEKNEHVLNCTNLLNFPNGTDSIETLMAENNTFIKITESVFLEKRLTSLKAAILGWNKIRSIEKGAFTGLGGLIVLDLNRNELEELKSDTFTGAHKLQVLVLNENLIKTVEESAFRNLSNLTYLDLSSNGISNLEQNFLKDLPRIVYLDLSRNPLNISGEETVLLSTSLQVLGLSSCGLQELPEDFLVELSGLKVLDLTGNELKALSNSFYNNLQILHINTISINESTFLPNSLKKISQFEMKLNSKIVVTQILNNLPDFVAGRKQLNFLKSCKNFNEDTEQENRNWKSVVAVYLLFFIVVYLSLVYVFLFTCYLTQSDPGVTAEAVRQVYAMDLLEDNKNYVDVYVE